MIKSKASGRTGLTVAAIIAGFIAAVAVEVVLLSKSGHYLVSDRGKAGVPRVLKETQIRTGDLPSLVKAMSRASAQVRYAALIFSAPDRPSGEDVLNLQLSFENGRVGFDWVLLAPRNIEDQEKFRAFARAHGVEPVARTMNGVSYLRVEHEDVARFTASVATELYRHPRNEPMGLIHEGFEWPQS